MSEPNILSFDLSDNQQEIVRKLNFNFDQISSANGGVQGPIGPTGATGLIGEIGSKGLTGLTGPRGTRWFVGGLSSPTGGYGDVAIQGDYWIDAAGADKPLYIFGPSGWINSGYNLIPNNEFSFIENLFSATGATTSYRAIIQNSSFPSENTLVISDGSPSIELTNPDYVNFLVTTDPQVNDYPILEFSRGESSIVGPSGYFRHPIWRWVGGINDYDIAFAVPSDRLSIYTGAGITGNVLGNFTTQSDNSTKLTGISSIDIQSGGPSYFKTSRSLGITASNITLSSSLLETSNDVLITTEPGKSPSNDPFFGNFSVLVNNPLGNAISLGSTNGPTGGNDILLASKDQIPLFSIGSNGNIFSKKNKSISHSPTFDSNSSINVNYGGGLIISWYYITPSSLGYNNTFIIDLNPANDLGIALNVRVGDSQNIMSLLEDYQSMRIKILTKTNLAEKKINYLGYFTGAPPASNQYVFFPDGINSAEFQIMRGKSVSATDCKCLYSSNLGSGRLF